MKASAKQIPTSLVLRRRYGEDVITDITCALCGGDEDSQRHLLCECPCTQRARDKIYKNLVVTVALHLGKSEAEVQRKVRSCWEGSYGQHTIGPLGELTYFGYLPVTLRQSLKGMGISDRMLSKIATDTVKHCQKVTHKTMWIRRTDAMKQSGRTLAQCLRRAGKVAGVAASASSLLARFS